MRRILVPILLAAPFLLLVAGAFTVRMSPSSESAAPDAASPVKSARHESSNDDATDEEVPARAEAVRARETATMAVSRLDELPGAGFISRGDILREVCTADYARVASRNMNIEFMQWGEDLLPEDISLAEVVWVEQPVTAIVDERTADRQVVEVWSVLVVASPDSATANQFWRTHRLVMVPADDGWLCEDWETTDTPAPLADVETSVLSATEALDGPMSWPVVERSE